MLPNNMTNNDTVKFGRTGLYAALLETVDFESMDRTYKRKFERAPNVGAKWQVLKEYVEEFPKCASKSEWFKTIVALAPCFKTGRQTLSRHDLRKGIIARIKMENPGFTQKQICAQLDAKNVRILRTWAHCGERTWSHCLQNAEVGHLVKSYLSKIKPAKHA